MKSVCKLFVILTVSIASANVAYAQGNKNDKKAELAEIVKKVINSNNYFFAPRYANSSGGSFDVPSNYTLNITKDSVTVYLPYYGRSQGQAPGADNNNETINFTWTKFSYVVNQDKKGNYDILILPPAQQALAMKDAKSLRLKISMDGSASLQVLSVNRSPISFDGSIGNRY
jgi:hypothetical protein